MFREITNYRRSGLRGYEAPRIRSVAFASERPLLRMSGDLRDYTSGTEFEEEEE